MNDPLDPFAEWDAAYVLGMLSPEDRRSFERHLSTCDSCRAAVTELAGMPGILGAISSEEAAVLDGLPDESTLSDGDHVPGRIQSLARASARRRRASRRRIGFLAAGLAILGLVGGGAIGSLAIGTPGGTAPSIQAVAPPSAPASAETPMKQVTPGVMTASLALTGKDWGTRLDWTCHYVDGAWTGSGSAPSYDLVVTDTSGKEHVVATWTASGPTASNLAASTAVHIGDIRTVEIRPTGTHTTLVKTTL